MGCSQEDTLLKESGSGAETAEGGARDQDFPLGCPWLCFPEGTVPGANDVVPLGQKKQGFPIISFLGPEVSKNPTESEHAPTPKPPQGMHHGCSGTRDRTFRRWLRVESTTSLREKAGSPHHFCLLGTQRRYHMIG